MTAASTREFPAMLTRGQWSHLVLQSLPGASGPLAPSPLRLPLRLRCGFITPRRALVPLWARHLKPQMALRRIEVEITVYSYLRVRRLDRPIALLEWSHLYCSNCHCGADMLKAIRL